jgi:DNA-binding winged helix-turn-helix (wHTH) protein/Flp pilus assembly protein TadD
MKCRSNADRLACAQKYGRKDAVEDKDRIDLAHAEPFPLGRIDVRPALRQLVRDDGREEVVEPRVMQVLVALARADGAILSRDDLTHCCWENRVVGEDAINRVISRLRRVAEGIGQDSFRIETITKVGYRLVQGAPGAAPTSRDEALASARADAHRLRLDRRAMVTGAGLAVAATGIGAFTWRHFLSSSDAPPADIAPLLEQARMASRQGNMDGGNQAMGLLRRVTEMRPDYANGWGLLAMNYAGASGSMSREAEAPMRTRAQDAISRTLKLDPDNPYARFARAMLDQRTGAWRRDELLARDVLKSDPQNDIAWIWLSGVLTNVGRCREAADLYEKAAKQRQPDPGFAYSRVVALWSAGRLDEADRASTDAIALFPLQFAVWFTRFYLLMYTGRTAEALAMSRNTQQRPVGFSDENFAMIEQIARAMETREPGQVRAAVATALDWAHRGAGYAENSIQFAAALGDVDTAFSIAEAYYFGRGFQTGENRFEPNQRIYTRQRNRRTRLLFLPSTAAMRSDPRFNRLVGELGLKRYWAESGTPPDYKRG